MKRLQRTVLAALLCLMLLPQHVGAYTYGDPNLETIAEAMKELIAKLNANPPDWEGTESVYQVHRPEIASHFDANVTETLDASLAAKEKDLFLSNYKAVLALNLERRFEYSYAAVNDYAQAKLLLAKAKGTYNVLQPYVSADVDAKVVPAFDEALEALGNPGLFGVGEKPVQPEVFKEKTDYILSAMKPLFPLKQAEAPKPAPAAEAPKPSTAAEAPEPAKPAAQPAKPAAEKPGEGSDSPAEQPAAENDPAQEREPAEQAAEPEAVETSAETSEATPAEQPGAEPPAETEAAQTETVASQDVSAAGEAHAPMERTQRTNPIISVIVIGAVLAAAAGGIWYAKKRQWF